MAAPASESDIARLTANQVKERQTSAALFTVAEAAKYLGVGRKKIYELIEWGELKAVKLGRSVQVEKNSLDEFKVSGKLT
jgi:excisionase family DNA binding protein